MFPVFFANLPYLLKGAFYTINLSVITVVLGLVLGATLGVLAYYGPRPIRMLIAVYVFFFRGLPVLIVVFLFYYLPPVWGIDLNVYLSAAIALVCYSGAFVTEIVRGAIGAIPASQIDAGKKRRDEDGADLVADRLTAGLAVFFAAAAQQHDHVDKDHILFLGGRSLGIDVRRARGGGADSGGFRNLSRRHGDLFSSLLPAIGPLKPTGAEARNSHICLISIAQNCPHYPCLSPGVHSGSHSLQFDLICLGINQASINTGYSASQIAGG